MSRSTQQGACYSFGEYRLCSKTRQLLHGDEPIALERRVFDVLTYLIENRDRAVPKDELEDAIWGGRPISHTVLSRCIMKARQAVGDDR